MKSEGGGKVVACQADLRGEGAASGLAGIARHASDFPSPVRRRLEYEPIEPFDLEELKRLAAESLPILPPTVFIPRPVVLARSVVEAKGDDLESVRVAVASGADMIICDVDGLLTPGQEATHEALAEALKSEGGGKVVACQADLRGEGAASGLANLLGALGETIHGLVLPEVDDVATVREAAGLLTEAEREVGLPVGALALGVRLTKPESVERDSEAIAEASRRMMWLILDLAQDMPKEDLADPATKGYLYYHSALVAATAHADIDAIDGPSEPEKVEDEASFVANLDLFRLLTEAEREVGLEVGELALGVRLTKPESVERDSEAIAEASRRMMWLILDLDQDMPKEDLADPTTKGSAKKPPTRLWPRP